jgi:hypothetical protein
MKTLIIKTLATWVVVHCGDGGFVEHDLLDGKMSKASAQQENVVVICVPPSNGNPYLKLAPLGGEMCPQGHIALDWCGLAKQ